MTNEDNTAATLIQMLDQAKGTQGAVPALTSVPQLMSSLEIAAVCEKQHGHVLRDIRQMLTSLYGQETLERVVPEHKRNRHSEFVRENAGAILETIAPRLKDDPKRDHLEISRGYTWSRDNRGYVSCFYLDYAHTLTLISGYRIELRKRIIDRWIQLEEAERRPAVDPMQVLNDPAAMRGLLLTYSEKVLTLEAEKAEAAPKLEAHDRIAEAFGSFCITDAAKMLQVQPKILFRWMSENKWIYRRTGTREWVGYQSKLASGCLIHKVDVFDKADGTDGTRTQVRVTPKGLLELAKAFPPALKEAV